MDKSVSLPVHELVHRTLSSKLHYPHDVSDPVPVQPHSCRENQLVHSSNLQLKTEPTNLYTVPTSSWKQNQPTCTLHPLQAENKTNQMVHSSDLQLKIEPTNSYTLPTSTWK